MENRNADIDLDKCPDELNEAGYAEVCTGCSGKRLCQEMLNRSDTDIEDINTRMSVIKRKILVLSGKGGVGKSTFTASMAMALAKQGYKVGVLDFDICGPSIANLLNVANQSITTTAWGWKPLVSPHYEIKVMTVAALINNKESAVIYKGPRKTNLIMRLLKETFWGKLDYLICDTPPGTSDEHLSIMRLLKQIKPDGAVIISTPQRLALDAVRKEITFCKKTKLKIIGVLENMTHFVCPCCNESYKVFPNYGVEAFVKDHNLAYLGGIQLDHNLADISEKGGNYFDSSNEAINKSLSDNLNQIIININNLVCK